MTADELRRRADELDREGEDALEKGDTIRASMCFLRAEMRREVAAEIDRVGIHKGHTLTPAGMKRAAKRLDELKRRLGAAVEQVRDVRVQAEALTSVNTTGKTKGVTPEHRARLGGAARKRKHGLYEHIGEGKKYPSLRALAAEIPMDPGFLSRCMKGDQSMPDDKAARIEALTGYPKDEWSR